MPIVPKINVYAIHYSVSQNPLGLVVDVRVKVFFECEGVELFVRECIIIFRTPLFTVPRLLFSFYKLQNYLFNLIDAQVWASRICGIYV